MTRTSEIDDLDRGPLGVFEEDVLGFEVAVENLDLAGMQEKQSCQQLTSGKRHLVGKLANEVK